MTPAERRERLAAIPWVTRLVPPGRCDGVKWKLVALRDLYAWGPRDDPRPPRGIPDKARCSKPGYWRFKALKKSRASDGTYCWHHLMSEGLYHDPLEQARLERWVKSRPDLFPTHTS